MSKSRKGVRGRPKTKINWKLLDQLLGIFCTGEECASVLGVSYDTVEKAIKREKKMNYTEYSELKKGSGRASLRRRQFRMAKTNPAMAIWLGKQYLGQKDDQRIIGTGKEGEILIRVVSDSTQEKDGNYLQAPRFAIPDLS